MLFVDRCLFVRCLLSSVIGRQLFVVCCLLPVVCLLVVVCGLFVLLMFVAFRVLCVVVCCPLFVVCCLLSVVCCMLLLFVFVV